MSTSPLAFLPPQEMSFRHARLAPATTFFYRVRAIHGTTSDAVDVALPTDLSATEYRAAFESGENFEWAVPAFDVARVSPVRAALKGASAKAAAPAGLTAELMSVTVSGFKLTWIDRASDEEGFLLERRAPGSRAFEVVAVVDPDINTFGWALAPPERNAAFRVRAYYHGTPSNIAQETTGSWER